MFGDIILCNWPQQRATGNRWRWDGVAEEKPKRSKFERFKESAVPRGYFNRNTEGLLLSENGVARLNVGASELLNGLALEQKLDRDKYVVGIEVSPDDMRIAVYAEKEGAAEGQLGVRRYKSKSPTVGFHLGAVLLKYPKLKVTYTRDCQVSRDKDDRGTPCLMINLGTALAYVGKGKKGTKAEKAGTETKNGDGTGKGTGTGSGAGEGAGAGSGEGGKKTGAAPSEQA